MLRLLYRGYRFTSAIWWWLRRRFRPAGGGVLVGMVGAACMGLDTTQNVAHMAFGLLMAILAVSISLGVMFRGRFGVERRMGRFATVGQPLRYGVVITNRTARVQRGLLMFENVGDTRMNYREFVAQLRAESVRSKSFRLGKQYRKPPRTLARIRPRELPSIPPGGTGEVQFEFVPVRRGVMQFEGVSVGRPDPLGVFVGCVRVRQPGRILILPKRYPLPPLALPGHTQYQQGGVAQASSVGESEEFVGLREYRPGDPPRRIHWPSWARVGTPVVREYQDEFFVRHALVLDTFIEAPDSELFEDAVSVAASFAYAIQTQESLLDLMFVGPKAFCFTAGRGLAHTEQMLEILASVNPCRELGFESLDGLVSQHIRAVSGCVVVLLAWDDARRALIRRLRASRLPLVVVVVVEPGEAEAMLGRMGVDRPERLHVLESGRIAEGLARL